MDRVERSATKLNQDNLNDTRANHNNQEQGMWQHAFKHPKLGRELASIKLIRQLME
jgi:hypothetical protein